MNDLQTILDRSKSIKKLVDKYIALWSYDLYAREPSELQFDMACVLSALVDRQAVVSLPTYHRKRAKTTRADEVVLSQRNRQGKLLGLVSNKYAFSFGVRIKDTNVVYTEGNKQIVGAPRNFMIIDIDGSWHPGFKKIHFVTTAAENDFLTDNNVWRGSAINFKNFVHPNRWSSFYGNNYINTKLLIDRLEQNVRFYQAEVTRLLDAGVRYPSSNGNFVERPKAVRSTSKSIQVQAFQCLVDAPFVKEFMPINTTQRSLVNVTKLLRQITNDFLPKLRFATRATEFAFVQSGCKEPPSWFKGGALENHVVLPGKRIKWQRHVMGAVSLRYRLYIKFERIHDEANKKS